MSTMRLYGMVLWYVCCLKYVYVYPACGGPPLPGASLRLADGGKPWLRIRSLSRLLPNKSFQSPLGRCANTALPNVLLERRIRSRGPKVPPISLPLPPTPPDPLTAVWWRDHEGETKYHGLLRLYSCAIDKKCIFGWTFVYNLNLRCILIIPKVFSLILISSKFTRPKELRRPKRNYQTPTNLCLQMFICLQCFTCITSW